MNHAKQILDSVIENQCQDEVEADSWEEFYEACVHTALASIEGEEIYGSPADRYRTKRAQVRLQLESLELTWIHHFASYRAWFKRNFN